MRKYLTSTQNPFVKELIQLNEKSRIRRKKNQFLIEGLREITFAIKGNYKITYLLVDFGILNETDLENLLSLSKDNIEIIEISNEIYKKLAFRDTTEGIIAVAQSKSLSLQKVKLPKNPLILVAEAPEKPGNIGALLRTADAAGIDAVFVANPKTDMYNPNIVRSSVGSLFTTNIATGSTTEILSFLKNNTIQIYGAALTASVPYTKVDFKNPCAIVVGTEATGLSAEWLQNTTKNIIIPMQGIVDSLNVSVSAAVLIYEAVRQRKLT